jgi:hypothetical protein
VARLEQRAQVVRRRRLAEGFGPRDTEKVAAFMEVEAQTARLAVLKDQDKLVEVELQVRRRRLDRLARLARLARLDRLASLAVLARLQCYIYIQISAFTHDVSQLSSNTSMLQLVKVTSTYSNTSLLSQVYMRESARQSSNLKRVLLPSVSPLQTCLNRVFTFQPSTGGSRLGHRERAAAARAGARGRRERRHGVR